MKNTVRTIAVLAVLVGLGSGCGKSEKSDTTPVPSAEAQNWEPESVDLPEGHSMDDGHDHSGHDHSGHDH